MLGDADTLRVKRKEQIKRLKELKAEENDALEVCKKELAAIKNLNPKVKLERKEMAEETFRKTKERVKGERAEMKLLLNDVIEAAESSWQSVARKVLSHCTWYELLYGKGENVYLNNTLVHRVRTLPMITSTVVSAPPDKCKDADADVDADADAPIQSLTEEFESSPSYNAKNSSSAIRRREIKNFRELRKIKLDYKRQQEKLKQREGEELVAAQAAAAVVNNKPDGSQVLLVLKTNTYQAIHKISSSSKFHQGFRNLLFTVSQESQRLRFLAYDFLTCNTFDFSYPKTEQKELVEGFKLVSLEEIHIQFEMGMVNAEVRDLPEEAATAPSPAIGSTNDGGSQLIPPTTYLTFGMEDEGTGVEYHLSAAEQKRAAKKLDEMMQQSADRQHSRQHSAEHKLADEEKGKWGLIEEDE